MSKSMSMGIGVVNLLIENLRNRKRQKSLLQLVTCLLILASIFSVTEFHLGQDDSLPQKYFVNFKYLMPKKGDMAVIRDHRTKYINDVSFIKIIAGIAGDVINIDADNQITINNQLVGRLRIKTLNGDDLTAIEQKIIPKDYVFVVGTHMRSFDSRYQEYGLVHLKNIAGLAYGF